MKTFTKSLLLFALAVVTMFSACREDATSTEVQINVPSPEKVYVTEVSGLVVNQNGDPVANAEVFMESVSTLTDEFGVFQIVGEADINHVPLRVLKDGYFNGVKVLTVAQGDLNKTEITLVEKGDAIQIKSVDGGLVQSNEVEIQFSANGIKDQSGNDYNGGVNVYTTYFDPSNDETYDIMPGDLSAINANNERRTLETFGMIGVQLESPSGEALQLSKDAEISIQVPQSMLADAPSSIPLWHMDEVSGYWIEEGSATLVGDRYVGTVSHFSFWNCDIPIEAITLRGTITTTIRNLSSPVAGVQVRVTQISTGDSRPSVTSDNGTYGGFVPANEPLLLQVFDRCGALVYSPEVGPFSTDQVFDLDIDFGEEIITLSGDVMSCAGGLHDDATVVVFSKTGILLDQLPVDDQGIFYGSILKCNFTELEVYAYDRTTNERSDRITIEASTGFASVPTISTCASNIESEFMRITFDDQSVFEYNMASGYIQDTVDVEIVVATGIAGSGARSVGLEISFVDWNADPSDPLVGWGYNLDYLGGTNGDPTFEFWVPKANGTPDQILDLIVGGPGELVNVKMIGFDVENPNTGEIRSNATFEAQFYR